MRFPNMLSLNIGPPPLRCTLFLLGCMSIPLLIQRGHTQTADAIDAQLTDDALQVANCADVGPFAAARAVVLELHPVHGEVVPSSIRFAHLHGIPCVDVIVGIASKPRHTNLVGVSYQVHSWLNSSRGSFHRGVPFIEKIEDIIRHPSVALVLFQTFEMNRFRRTSSPNGADSLLARLYRRVRAGVPIFLGCHDARSCDRISTRIPASRSPNHRSLNHRSPVIPLCFAPPMYTLHNRLMRSRGTYPHPTLLIPCYMGPEDTFMKHRDINQDDEKTPGEVVFAVFSQYNIYRIEATDWGSLRTLASLDAEFGYVRVVLFGKEYVHPPYTLADSTSAWNQLDVALRAGTHDRVRIQRIQGTWQDGINIAARADYVLPMITDDYSVPASRVYLEEKLASSISIAIASQTPLVVWHTLARAYGLRKQITYESGDGLRDAIQRAIIEIKSATLDETRTCAGSAQGNSVYGQAKLELCRKQKTLFDGAITHSCKNSAAIPRMSQLPACNGSHAYPYQHTLSA